MCLTATCNACLGQAVVPTTGTFVPAEKRAEAIGYAVVLFEEPAPDIWRPPQ